ncbi:MAG: S8 family peptidase [bacterium]
MRNFFLTVLILAVAVPGLVWAFPSRAPFSLKGRPLYVPGEVLVTLKAGASFVDRAHALGLMGSAQALLRANLYKVNVAGGMSVEAAVDQFRREAAVEAVQPNYRYYALGSCSAPPTDPYYQGSPYSAGVSNLGQSVPYWPFQKISAPAAWATFCSQYTGGSVTVASIDSGVNFSNADLPSSVSVPGYNYISFNSDTDDDLGHGTFVASLIAAQWDGEGMAGLAGMPGVVKIMPMKVLDNTGEGSTESIVDGLNYAYVHGVRIYNMSLGGPQDPLEEQEINKLLSNNCVVVAAAGNEDGALDYPAAYPGVISVGATDENNQPTFYSNFGPGLDLVAPGGAGISFVYEVYAPNSDILGLLAPGATSCLSDPNDGDCFPASPDSHYGTGAGTSFSTPLVTGAAALLLALNPYMTNQEVTNRLINSADSLNGNQGWDAHTGYGLLDVARALQTNGGQITPYLRTFNSPNPFSIQSDGSTNITLAIDQPESVELTIEDAAGDMVLRKTFSASELNHNPSNPQYKSYYISWDGRNGDGNWVVPGVYFYRVSAGGVTGRNKIVVIQGAFTGVR